MRQDSEPLIQLDEVDARETIINMFKTGQWTAHQSPDGKRLFLRYRAESIRSPSDLTPLHIENLRISEKN